MSHLGQLKSCITPGHIGVHFGPFSEASDRPKGQEQGGGAVGSQEGLPVVKF